MNTNSGVDKAIDPKIVDQIRQELLGVRAGIDERRSKLAKHVHHREEPIPQDFSEQAVAMENDETMVALEHELAARQAAVDAALARLDDGTYGVCTGCGNPIAAERLQAIPEATLCFSCVDE